MNGKMIFTPTEARQNFFALLKRAEKGKEIIIRTKEALFRFKLEEIEEASKQKKLQAIEDLSKIGLRSMPVKEMKRIILQMHDIKLEK